MISIFGHLNFILTLFSYMVKDMLQLRILAIFAAVCGIVYALFYTTEILWVSLVWEVGFITINGYHVISLLNQRRGISLTDEEIEIHKAFFHSMSVFDFKKLVSAGEWKTFERNEILIKEGKPVGNIAIISTGQADIIAGGRIVARCGKGALLGEMSFVTGETASATVQASETTKCIVWQHSRIHELIDHDDMLKQGFQSALSENLIRKLIRHQSDPELEAKKIEPKKKKKKKR